MNPRETPSPTSLLSNFSWPYRYIHSTCFSALSFAGATSLHQLISKCAQLTKPVCALLLLMPCHRKCVVSRYGTRMNPVKMKSLLLLAGSFNCSPLPSAAIRRPSPPPTGALRLIPRPMRPIHDPHMGPYAPTWTIWAIQVNIIQYD